MLVAALTELAGTVDAEVPRLARDLGCTAYDARLCLNAGCPAVVRVTPDAEEVRALLEKLRARGHRAVGCALSLVAPSERMVSLRRFLLGDDAVAAGDREGVRLPYAGIAALLRATHVRRTEVQSEVHEKKFSVGRALLTSGLMMNKTVTREVTTVTEEREEVLYLFARDGSTPFILREHETQYAGLGAQVSPTRHANFLATVERLRGLAPGAAWSEQLLRFRKVPDLVARAAQSEPALHASPDGGMDLLAHLLAQSLLA